jgi:succinyl-CoA synthetase beta subunit
MKLLEYEAKHILRSSHLSIPSGVLVTARDTPSVSLPIVLKSQVPVGGRGKVGGVIVIEKMAQLQPAIDKLLSLDIKGHVATTLLAEEKLVIKRELYVSLTIDRGRSAIRLTAHTDGGVEVESNEDFFTTTITHRTIRSCADQLASYFGYPSTLVLPFVTHLYDAFVKNDATLLEINPLVYTDDGQLVCGDCKMELDDAAAFRHPDWQFEATPTNANFVTLDHKGTVATIANGAGLAMATVDAVAHAGLTPANFLDIGGGASTETILAAFQQIMTFPHIEAIVINIFAGITRCDEVARAVVAARQRIAHLPALSIRLAGTNFEEAVELLASESVPTLATLEECLAAVKESTRA